MNVVKEMCIWLFCWMMLVSIPGCADHTETVANIRSQNNAMLGYLGTQQTNNQNNRASMMLAMSAATSAAAKTPSATDDTTIALAWGFAMARQTPIHMPNLQPIPRAKDGVDYMKAALPWVALALPYIHNGWGDESTSTSNSPSITATEGSMVFLDSGTKTAGGDMQLKNWFLNGGDYNNTCPEGECGEEELPEGEPPPDNEGGLGACLENPPGGHTNSGTPLWTLDPTCSCHSHFAGQC